MSARRPSPPLSLFALSLLLVPALSAKAAAQAAEPQGDRPGPGPVETRTLDAALWEGLEFRSVGPSRGGRVTTVAGHPDRPGTYYAGSTGGGLWKTTDYGNTWRNLTDHAFATSSMGAVQVARSNPDVVYAGTGSDGIRSNVITGRGVYRSDDAGESWRFLGLREAGQIGAVQVDPRDPDRAYLAALGHPFGKNDERGVFRTTDGGESWEKVLFASDSVGAIDLELNPEDPDEIYATLWRGERKPWTIISGCDGSRCGDGIWKSTDGGETWRRLGNGLPEGLIGKIDLAVTPADPDRIYALVEAPEGEEGLYRSDDRGESWRLVNDREGLMNRPFYFTNVTAHPRAADELYVGNVRFFRSENGGESFERLSTPHADNHALWIDPERPDVMVQGNDGGATVTLDRGATWSRQTNQTTAELYQVDVDERFPYWLYAGQQDHSTIAVPSLPPARSAPGGGTTWWEAVGGCETGPIVPRPDDPSVVYGNCKGRFGRYSRRTGQEQNYWVGAQYMYGRNPAELEYRFQRTVPIEVSPHDPDVVYHASQYVHRTTDDGATWDRISPDLTARPPEHQVVSGGPITRDITGEEHFSTLYVVEESPLEEGLLWVGSNDGPVHVTRDGGESWTEVTPPGWEVDGRINAIDPSPHDPGGAIVTGYRFLLDDWRPYVFRTEDYGETWTRIADGTRGIPPDHPVRVVRQDPDREGLLYAGTEFGLHVSFDAGASWRPFQLDLPVTPVTDIEIHRKDLVLSTMGRGFWILDDLTPLHRITAASGRAPFHLFAPREAIRTRYDRTPGSYRHQAPHAPEYPEPGATLHYWLGEEPPGEVRLEILDADGEVVRGFSSDERGWAVTGADRMAAPGPGAGSRLQGPRLATSRGTHRIRWNFRYPGPLTSDGGRGRGPLATPGEYTVRLTVGGESRSAPLRVGLDPRVRAEGVTRDDLEEQLVLNLRIRDAISEGRRGDERISSLRERVEEARESGAVPPETASSLDARLQELHARLVTSGRGSYPPPMILDQLGYLYGMTTGSDQRPGADAVRRLGQLRERLDVVLDALEATGKRVRDRLADAR